MPLSLTYILVINEDKLFQFFKIIGICFIRIFAFHIDVSKESRLHCVCLGCQRIMPILGRGQNLLPEWLIYISVDYWSEK